MIAILFVTFLFTSMLGWAQSDSGIVRFINPSALSAPKGYSHAVSIDLGNCQMIVLSGQVALDKNGNLTGKDNIEKQTEQVFTNIKNALLDFGGKMDNLIKINYYILDVSVIQTIRDVRDKYINVKSPPASTLVQVSKLYRGDLLIEIEATAVIPKK